MAIAIAAKGITECVGAHGPVRADRHRHCNAHGPRRIGERCALISAIPVDSDRAKRAADLNAPPGLNAPPSRSVPSGPERRVYLAITVEVAAWHLAKTASPAPRTARR
jgi:hypothetical protein